MVLGFKKKKPPDPYLTQVINTERFRLVNCNRLQAIQITMPWHNDPEILGNLMYSKAKYSRREWARKIGKPDGNKRFYHAIIAKDIKGTIGTHRLILDKSGTVRLAIVIHAKEWWGKDVFAEVRTAIMDHFSQSPRVVRFHGQVLTRNIRSIYNYQKLGFRVIGYDRKVWKSPITDEYEDTMHFEYLAEDWRADRTEHLT